MKRFVFALLFLFTLQSAQAQDCAQKVNNATVYVPPTVENVEDGERLVAERADGVCVGSDTFSVDNGATLALAGSDEFNIDQNGYAAGDVIRFRDRGTAVTFQACGEVNVPSEVCRDDLTYDDEKFYKVNSFTADTKIYLASDSIGAGETTELPVRINGADSLTTFQWTLAYDPSVAQIDTVTAGLSDFGTQNYAHPSDSTMTVSWATGDGEPQNLADSTSLFTLKFTAVGDGGDSTSVAFKNQPTPKEVTQGMEVVPTEFTDGSLYLHKILTVSGAFQYYDGGGVSATAYLDSLQQTGSTFSFQSVVEGEYTLSASREVQDRLNGITSLDILYMRRDILGIDSLASMPREAADVNNSGDLTTLDIVNTRRVILGVQDEFPASGWQFVPQDTTLNVSGDLTGISITGVKTGDVNASFTEGSNSKLAEGETNPLRLAVGEQDGRKTLYFAEPRRLSAFQFTLAGVRDVQSKLRGLTEDHISVKPDGTAVVWTDGDGESTRFASGEEIISFKEDGNVELMSEPTPALAYTEDESSLGIVTGESGSLKIGEIYPNPANNQITVEYTLPGGKREGTIYNLLGQKVGTYTLTGTKRDIDVSGISSGTYFFQINNETKKFVVIK